MSERYVVNADTATAGCRLIRVSVSSSSSNVPPERVPQTMPGSIPASQRYYWSHSWQQGETEAVEALERGESEEFTNFRDLASYLLRVDDE